MNRYSARNYVNVTRIQTYLSIAYKDNSCLHSRLKNMNFLYRKVMLKPRPEYARENGSMAPLSINLSIRWSRMVNFMPRSFYPEKKPPPIRFLLGRPQSSSRHCVGKEIYLPLLGIEPRFLGRPVRDLFTLLPETYIYVSF
jgi:hypothetical protein